MKEDPNIPAEVRAVLDELQLEDEEDEPTPDEQQLEVLEDIWLKAGEIGMLSFTLKNLLSFSSY